MGDVLAKVDGRTAVRSADLLENEAVRGRSGAMWVAPASRMKCRKEQPLPRLWSSSGPMPVGWGSRSVFPGIEGKMVGAACLWVVAEGLQDRLQPGTGSAGGSGSGPPVAPMRSQPLSRHPTISQPA